MGGVMQYFGFILLGTGDGAALDATPKDPGTDLQDKIAPACKGEMQIGTAKSFALLNNTLQNRRLCV